MEDMINELFNNEGDKKVPFMGGILDNTLTTAEDVLLW